MQAALRHAGRPDVRARWVSRLQALVRLPTMSVDARRRPDLERAARLLMGWLPATAPDDVVLARADRYGRPNVLARWDPLPGAPVLLLYAHFDVQPPGPAHLWHDPPFSGRVTGHRVLGRGASDNKGPLVAILAALESYATAARRLPVNVRLWLDPEEEIGNPGLQRFLARHRERLRCDALVVCDHTRLTGADRADLVTGLRGVVDLELTVFGPPRQLHSGLFGGEVADPAMVLAGLLGSIWYAGRITVPGLYDGVRPVRSAERARLAAGLQGPAALARSVGLPPRRLVGEPGWAPGERATLRPSVTVTHLRTGATPGSLTPAAIATSATAWLNLRLVPEQDPDDVVRDVQRHLKSRTPPGVTVRLRRLRSAPPVAVRTDSPVVRAAVRALSATWGLPPLPARSGGTVPVVAELHRRWGVPVAMSGLSTPSDRVHGANESFSLTELRRGTEAAIRLLAELS
jgi:acetylornithine deacetylase/succinyl-diaminopimelate desuccinylase-like protein